MSTHGPLYTYEPLSRDYDELRLVKLQPRCSSSHIEIEITHTPSSAPPAYEALSYVWGSSERTHNVIVKTFSDSPLACTSSVEEQQDLIQRIQPRHLPISRNVSVALEHLRLSEEPRLLWIDAICINQDDIPERSEQVNKMGPIYSKARRVILWLGEEADDSTSALTTLKALGEGIDLSLFKDTGYKLNLRPNSLAKKLESKLSDSMVVVDLMPGWRAIAKLLERPWFTRLWVIQEMVLAADAIFLVGSAVLGFPLFRSAILWIRYVGYATGTLERISGFELIERTCEILVCDLGIDLSQAVCLARRKQCIDPRDKIYAILSLVSSGFSRRIIPDYLRPPEEIFKEIVLHHIDWTKRLSLLCLCRFSNPTSWVLDFSASSEPLRRPYFDASGRSREESIYNPSIDSLQICGRQVCTVDKIFETVPFQSKLSETLAICQSWERAWKSAIPQVGVAFNEDAFLATIFSGPLADSFIDNNNIDVRELDLLYRNSCEQGCFQPSSIKDRSWATQYGIRISYYLNGYSFFISSSGLVGLCPSWAAEGDIIIVALGCDSLLVLRSAGANHYKVGGSCFVHGMMNGKALVGSFDPETRYSWKVVHGNKVPMTEDSDGTATQLDPRAGPLPPGWSVFYESKSGEPVPEIVDGEFQTQYFRNSETGEESWFDPRMTSENLRKRGVDIQEFVLV